MNKSAIPRYSNPFFLFDLDKVRYQFERLRNTFPGGLIRYAIKANNHEEILSTLIEMGSGFEIGSKQEGEKVIGLGAKPENIIFSAPVKLPSHIREAYASGIDLFVFDSDEELEKLALLAPGSRVMVRIAVNNEGSLFQLGLKFGIPWDEAVELMERARLRGMKPYGVAFHVGSQCERKETWAEAVETASKAWKRLESRGINLECLNIGGGFPVPYQGDVPTIEEIASVVYDAIDRHFGHYLNLMLEPGRFMVAESAMLVSTVIGKTKKGNDEWLFLDVGAFHGLLEAQQLKGRFPYRIRTVQENRPLKKYKISGPTCDPDDTIIYDVMLPEVNVGDKLYVMNTGAYSFVYASQFHGFSPPEIKFISKHEPELVPLGTTSEEKSGVRRYDDPEYGEARRYELELGGEVCKVYYDIGYVPDDWKEKLWKLYDECMHLDDAIQEQSCYTKETFYEALSDSDYNNSVLVINDEPMGLVLLTNNLEKAAITYINPNYMRKCFPEETSSGKFWYITTVFISPKVRNLGFMSLLCESLVLEMRDKGYTIGFDLSDSRLGLADVVVRIAKENGWQLEKKLIGRQSYYAFVNVSVDQELDRSRSEKDLLVPDR